MKIGKRRKERFVEVPSEKNWVKKKAALEMLAKSVLIHNIWMRIQNDIEPVVRCNMFNVYGRVNDACVITEF